MKNTEIERKYKGYIILPSTHYDPFLDKENTIWLWKSSKDSDFHDASDTLSQAKADINWCIKNAKVEVI
jgi:hypothetical protein